MPREITIALDTLGCKLNQAETEALARRFAGAGYRVVPPSEAADVYVLNTCTVTHVADSKSRHLLRVARRRNPTAIVIATGCYAERDAHAFDGLDGVGVRVIPADGGGTDLFTRVQGLVSGGVAEDSVAPSGLRTRSFIKVQAGCSHFCAYCIVPLVKGPEASVPADDIVESVRRRTAEGYHEVVLTGTRVGAYSSAGTDLGGLLQRVLRQTGIARVRLSSLQPEEISAGLVRLWQDSRLCPHFHMALQSGSDAVLARMKRRYTSGEFERVVRLLREAVPDAAITTDVIVGFPGETEEEFRESRDFCRRLGFARIHVFPFSPRSGTLAASLRPAVTESVKKDRSRTMLELGRQSEDGFQQGFTGRTMPVLFESGSRGRWSGLTGNYIRVTVPSAQDLTNRLLPVRLLAADGDGMRGKLVPG